MQECAPAEVLSSPFAARHPGSYVHSMTETKSVSTVPSQTARLISAVVIGWLLLTAYQSDDQPGVKNIYRLSP